MFVNNELYIAALVCRPARVLRLLCKDAKIALRVIQAPNDRVFAKIGFS